MILHDFLAVCPSGHKRNFVWENESLKPMAIVKDTCVVCNKEVYFAIQEYHQEPQDEATFKGVSNVRD